MRFEDKVKIQVKVTISPGVQVMAVVWVRARYPGPG